MGSGEGWLESWCSALCYSAVSTTLTIYCLLSATIQSTYRKLPPVEVLYPPQSYMLCMRNFFFFSLSLRFCLQESVCLTLVKKKKKIVHSVFTSCVALADWLGGFALMCSNMRLRTDAGRHG